MTRLEADHVHFAAVEVEALALVHPWPDDDATFDHLRFLAASFARRGYPLLLATATVTGLIYLARVRAALATDDFLLVRLRAPAELLCKRVVEREPPGWVGLPRLLDATVRLAASMETLPGVDIVLDSEAEDVEQLVSTVYGRLLS